MRADPWKQITQYAEVQHGLVSLGQIRATGVGYASVRRAVASGLLLPVRRSVLAVAGAPHSVWRSLMAAYLAAGLDEVAASHRAAGGLHGLPGIVPGAVELTSWHSRPLRLSDVPCHWTTTIVSQDIAHLQGFRATSAARTIVDLAATGIHRSLLARMVAHAGRKGLCSVSELERQVVRLGGSGRSGTRKLRDVLADPAGGDSELEARWLRVLTRAGLRPAALQHQVVAGDRLLILDFAWPEARVGMEVDGWEVHGERSAWDRDHDKINAYGEAGWRVLFVTSRTSTEDVIRQLRQFISRNMTAYRSSSAK